jgi:hypothetical protein
MLTLKLESNQRRIAQINAIHVTENLLNSHYHMVKSAMRTIKEPMIMWINDLEIEAFKDSMDTSKEVCKRIDEQGKKHERDFHFHRYKGQAFALAPSMQKLEVDKETTFVEGGGVYWLRTKMWGNEKLCIVAYPENDTDPVTEMIHEPPVKRDEMTPVSEEHKAERFNNCGFLSVKNFTKLQE